MTDESNCHDCGAPLLQGAFGPFCPRCLIGMGIDEASGALKDIPDGGSRRFAHFELLEEISRGGMGVVWRARQTDLDRIVAVKTILSGLFAKEEEIRRFRLEAQAVARLRNPNIVAIYEIGRHENQDYFSMEFVEGKTLADLVADRSLDARSAAEFLKSIASAVQYAHEQGVVHRDLKPSNILVDDENQPRITDFGLARQLEGVSELTVTGQVLGSPSYMAPEQAEGGKSVVAPSTDIYALGAILYHFLTGRPPFIGPTLESVLTQILRHDPVPPRRLNPSLPKDLETICMKCLEKKPRQRYVSARDLADDLGLYLEGRPIRARPLGRSELLIRWSQRNPTISALSAIFACLALIVMLVIALAAFRLSHQRAQLEQNLYAADVNLAFQAFEQGKLGQSRELLLAHLPSDQDGDIRELAWQYLWAQSRGDQTAVLGGHSNVVSAVAYAPDGGSMAAGDFDGRVLIRSALSGDVLQSFHFADQRVTSVDFAHDGDLLAVGVDQIDSSRVVVLDWRTGEKIFQKAPAEYPILSFSPNADLLAIGAGGALHGGRNGQTSVWNYRENRLIADLPASGGRAAFSPDGRWLATGSWSDQIKIWRVRASNPQEGDARGPSISGDPEASIEFVRAVDNAPWTISIAFSHDGRSMAATHWDESGAIGGPQLWDVESGELKAVLKGSSMKVWDADFSPDDSRLAACGSDQMIRVWNLENMRQERVLKGHEGEIWSIEFAPKDRALVSGGKDATARLWALPADEPQVEFPNGHWPAILSRDGRLAARATQDETTIRVWDAKTGLPSGEVEGRFPVAFNMDGSELLFLGKLGVSGGHWWSFAEKRVVRQFKIPGHLISRSTQLDGGRLLASYDPEGNVNILDSKSGEIVARLPGHSGQAYSAALSKDRRILATSDESSDIRIWDWPSGRLSRILTGHKLSVSSLAFSPDGKLLASGSFDDTIRLWDLKTWRETAVLGGHHAGVSSIVYSPGGKTLAAVVGQGMIKLWHTATLRELGYIKQSDPLTWLQISEDGTVLLASGSEVGGIARVWRLPGLDEIDAGFRD